jgi:hypothetical protein
MPDPFEHLAAMIRSQTPPMGAAARPYYTIDVVRAPERTKLTGRERTARQRRGRGARVERALRHLG